MIGKVFIVILMLILVGLSFYFIYEISTEVVNKTSNVTSDICGDAICGSNEDYNICPVDCKARLGK